MTDYFDLAERIQELRDEVCCPSYAAAARAMCGCKGIAAEALRELEADLDREMA